MAWFKKNPVRVTLRNLPKHVAICAVPNDLSNLDVLVKNIQKMVATLVKLRVPVISFYIMPLQVKNSGGRYSDYVSILMQELSYWDYLDENMIKVSVLGNWYDLPGRVVDPVKKVQEKTKHYDKHFLNFCVNYSGQHELLSALRLIAKKIELDKLDPEMLDYEIIKEHLHTSYFIPPDLMIVTGSRPVIDGFLLWDSGRAHVHIIQKTWSEVNRMDILSGLREYQKMHR